MSIYFQAANIHSAGCGVAPEIKAQEYIYAAYWENCHGEQFILVRERDSRQFVLYGGNLTWDEPLRFKDIQEFGTLGIILGRWETTWLVSCLCAATEFDRPRRVPVAVADKMLNAFQLG